MAAANELHTGGILNVTDGQVNIDWKCTMSYSYWWYTYHPCVTPYLPLSHLKFWHLQRLQTEINLLLCGVATQGRKVSAF